jgi:hypothetical protein
MNDRIYDFKNLRPPASYPVYPPYHKGKYLEEYFYNFYIKNKQKFDETGFTYIPIFWTNIYITNTNRNLIQPYLNALPAGKYFTVSQHDDAVTEILPKNTLSFEAGGNKNGIPIPLICSSINTDNSSPIAKDIFCSFVGSILSGSLRHKLYNIFSNDSDFYFSPQDWTTNVQQTRLEHFIKTTKRSKFTLCPRGYGAQSFRVYETLQLNSIPVIIYDKEWLPFNDEVDWSTFSVLVHESEMYLLKEKLLQISDTSFYEMVQKGQKIYKDYFTLESTSKHIFNILNRASNTK